MLLKVASRGRFAHGDGADQRAVAEAGQPAAASAPRCRGRRCRAQRFRCAGRRRSRRPPSPRLCSSNTTRSWRKSPPASAVFGSGTETPRMPASPASCQKGALHHAVRRATWRCARPGRAGRRSGLTLSRKRVISSSCMAIGSGDVENAHGDVMGCGLSDPSFPAHAGTQASPASRAAARSAGSLGPRMRGETREIGVGGKHLERANGLEAVDVGGREAPVAERLVVVEAERGRAGAARRRASWRSAAPGRAAPRRLASGRFRGRRCVGGVGASSRVEDGGRAGVAAGEGFGPFGSGACVSEERR